MEFSDEKGSLYRVIGNPKIRREDNIWEVTLEPIKKGDFFSTNRLTRELVDKWANMGARRFAAKIEKGVSTPSGDLRWVSSALKAIKDGEMFRSAHFPKELVMTLFT